MYSFNLLKEGEGQEFCDRCCDVWILKSVTMGGGESKNSPILRDVIYVRTLVGFREVINQLL